MPQNRTESAPSATLAYLRSLGVPDMPPRTAPLDPGYDPVTVESHLEQSAHLIEMLKISMACWQIANIGATRKKVASARRFGVGVVTGGGPFEIAATFGKVPEYLDLCANIGVNRIEAGEGFTENDLDPPTIIAMCRERGLNVQFELGKKHEGAFGEDTVSAMIDQGKEWMDAGAVQLIVEAREDASNVGLFGSDGKFDTSGAERLVNAFGFEKISFEAPNKASQFATINHFGPQVHICNVRIEELLRVEIYRRGLHSDAFEHDNLRPAGPGKN